LYRYSLLQIPPSDSKQHPRSEQGLVSYLCTMYVTYLAMGLGQRIHTICFACCR
jgi:hypothetical protein